MKRANIKFCYLDTLGAINRDSYHGSRGVVCAANLDQIWTCVGRLTQGKLRTRSSMERHEIFTNCDWRMSGEPIASHQRV